MKKQIILSVIISYAHINFCSERNEINTPPFAHRPFTEQTLSKNKLEESNHSLWTINSNISLSENKSMTSQANSSPSPITAASVNISLEQDDFSSFHSPSANTIPEPEQINCPESTPQNLSLSIKAKEAFKPIEELFTKKEEKKEFSTEFRCENGTWKKIQTPTSPILVGGKLIQANIRFVEPYENNK